MELLPFQIAASTEIADKCWDYLQDPITQNRTKIVPYIQTLSSITGSGKTLILADTVEQIRGRLSVEPIVLWLSKGRVVVSQTLQNLEGKYAPLIGGYEVKALLDCKPSDVEETGRGLLLVATVAKFNQRDKEQGDRKIFKLGLDSAEQPLWELLKERRNSKGRRRPLIVVYDEGHNLSDQQTDLILELGPDALIMASATLRVPDKLSKFIDRLRDEKGWTDGDLVTSVRSGDVVNSGLVKKNILLGGYCTPMEIAIDEMLDELKQANKTTEDLSLHFRPKAIYVSSTNALFGVPIKEDMARPFSERMARPIVIWRHLVEANGIDPADIAVYCDLKFDNRYPPPAGFNLFSGGDADYDRFVSGQYQHIIFNLSLQEGWDDPECSFAYIDKEMGSADQITQIIGRVLRQPGAQHYPSPILNTAHFYIRADEEGVFDEVLNHVRKKLAAETPEVTLTVRKGTKGGARPTRPALKERVVPKAQIHSKVAQKHIKDVIDRTLDFRYGAESQVIGKGGRIQVLQTIGTNEDAIQEWVEVEHSNPVTARWVFTREIQQRQPKAVRLCDIELEKFDALVEYTSPAAHHLREQAVKVVEAYVDHSVIVQHTLDHPYKVDSVPVDEAHLEKFNNAIHEGYSGLNGFELDFARALDKTKRVWCRNPSQGAYGIPLLDHGSTRTFNPDFLVWTERDKYVVAIDTKGDHLIVQDAARKLFHIEKIGDGPELVIRLVTEGKWFANHGEIGKTEGVGYTVWSLKQGKLHTEYCANAAQAVEACLRI